MTVAVGLQLAVVDRGESRRGGDEPSSGDLFEAELVSAEPHHLDGHDPVAGSTLGGGAQRKEPRRVAANDFQVTGARVQGAHSFGRQARRRGAGEHASHRLFAALARRGFRHDRGRACEIRAEGGLTRKARRLRPDVDVRGQSPDPTPVVPAFGTTPLLCRLRWPVGPLGSAAGRGRGVGRRRSGRLVPRRVRRWRAGACGARWAGSQAPRSGRSR